MPSISLPDTALEVWTVSPFWDEWKGEPEEGSKGSESFSIILPAHAEFPDSEVPDWVFELSAGPNNENSPFPADTWKKRRQNKTPMYLWAYLTTVYLRLELFCIHYVINQFLWFCPFDSFLFSERHWNRNKKWK